MARNGWASLAVAVAGFVPLQGGEVEIKYVIHAEDFERAVKAASEKQDAIEERNIYFIETKDRALGTAELILRLREKPGKKDDSTVKLRGAQAPEVDEKAFAPADADEEAKLEIDRVIGGKDVTSFSITAKQGKGEVAKLRVGEKTLGQMFTKTQEAFLARYAKGIDWEKAPLLGPVKTEKWEFEINGFEGKLTAEVWHLPDCKPERMVEFSIKTDCAKADSIATKLQNRMSVLKLRQSDNPESKTALVLKCLLEHAK